MRQRTVVLTSAVVSAAAISVAMAGVKQFRSRPQLLCGLPPHHYAQIDQQPPIVGRTGTGIPINVPIALPGSVISTSAGPVVEWKVYQLDTPTLQIAQCVISSVALSIAHDGRWRLNLNAAQNPRSPTDPDGPLSFRDPNTGALLQTSQIKRNQFLIEARGIGLSRTPEEVLARPVFFEIDIPPFWVENGHPESKLFTGRCDAIGQYFSVIDRVEIEFTFR